MAIEAFAFLWLIAGQPLLGDFYEPSVGWSLVFSFTVGFLTLLLWRMLVGASQRGCLRTNAQPVGIPTLLVWFVLCANAVATIAFDYGRVGYAGVSWGFLITIIPLDALILAHMCVRKRVDWAILLSFATLGLMRGWTSHLFLVFLAVLLVSTQRRQWQLMLLTGLLVVFLFEPMMALRSTVRGFDDAEGGFLHRIGSRLAMTPIIDHLINALPAIVLCQGETLTPWWREMLSSVIPKGLLGDGGTRVIHYCIAAAASGDPNVEITFSSTLFPKLVSFALNGWQELGLASSAVIALLAVQLTLARRALGSLGYVYVGAFLHVFLVSGVLRDVVVPTYFLLLLGLVRLVSPTKSRAVANTSTRSLPNLQQAPSGIR